MDITRRFIPLGLVAALALASLPALAQEAVTTSASLHGAVTAVALHDDDHDGRMDRVHLTLDNSDHRTWRANGAAGFALKRNGADITLTGAYVSTPPGAHPASLQILLDTSDADLPRTTSAEGFELSYAPQGLGLGVDDGETELAAIAEGDTGAHDTELDMANPILIDSDPVAGMYRVLRNHPITLTFSEAVVPESLAYESANNPGSWSASWSSDATTVTLNHGLYQVVLESFTVTAANDLAGNAVVRGTYPNPFTFETTSVNDTQMPDRPNPILAVMRPAQLATLEIGTANLINWYTNEPEAASVRLSYSKDGGTSYQVITTKSASEGAYVWYPPNLPGSLILKAESLTSAGIVMNIVTVNPLSLALPSVMPMPFAVLGPTVSDATDTTAKVAMTLDRPVDSAALVCNGTTLASPAVPMTAPSEISVALSGLATGTGYDCHIELIDIYGRTSSITVPSFLASSAGDITAPKIVGIPKVDMYDATAGTVRLSWTTDEPTTGHINYGPYLNYGNFVDATTLKTSHSVTLSANLTPGALHQARVEMIDSAGNVSVTDDIWFVFLTENMLVKAKDSSAVYWYHDGRRDVFPNADIYRSWFGDDFSDVVTIPTTQLGTVALGENVKMKADTFLVKITSDPKTYAVEPDGTLRWITSETQARTLYGAAWNTIIRDVDVSLFVDYAIGEPLADGEKPAGYAR